MATLQDEFERRYSEARKIQLSNPDMVAPTGIDYTRLEACAEDAEADFRQLAQIPYDPSDRDHVRVGVILLEANLLEKGTATSPAAEGMRKEASERAGALKAAAGGRGRAKVETTLIESPYKFSGMLPGPRVRPDGSRYGT